MDTALEAARCGRVGRLRPAVGDLSRTTPLNAPASSNAPAALRAAFTTAMALLMTTALVPLAAADNAASGVAGATQQATATDPAGGLDPAVAATLQQQQKMLEDQARQLQEQARVLAKQQEMLRQQQQQLDALQRQATPGIKPATLTAPVGTGWYLPVQDVEPVAPDIGGEPMPVPPDAGTEPAPVPPAPVAGNETEEQRPESEKPTDQLLLERGAILLPAGTLQVEPSVEYTHVSANQLAVSGFTIFDAIVIGNIEVDDLSRDIVTAAASIRYGIIDRLQVEARIPYLYRTDDEIFGFGTNNQDEFRSDNMGLGDVEASASYQLIIGDGGAIPDTIVRAHGRFPTGEDPFDIDTIDLGDNRHALEEPPTGSGFYGVGGGATMVWRVDPVVFFTGLDATINLPRTFDAVGEIDPGDTYQAFGGVNVQLSELVSLNLSFVEQYTRKSEQEGIKIDGTSLNDARLVLGTAVGVGSNASLTFNAAAGLTKESPDFVFTISLPISFSLF
jgi:hypothetical protein